MSAANDILSFPHVAIDLRRCGGNYPESTGFVADVKLHVGLGLGYLGLGDLGLGYLGLGYLGLGYLGLGYLGLGDQRKSP